METIKVNMNPNPLDVQTIHASQNDGEARQWGFELHNNGELIDTSDVKEQLVFKAYKGGTEQILPENTSTPTTSPFKGDIRYPQGLLSDQEFTYRQSPTEEDGLAKITDIKGNTLVWNQLLNVEAYTTNTSNGVTFTKNSNNTISITGTATGRASSTNFARPQITNGHKYLLYLSKALTNIYLRSTVGFTASVQNSAIFTATADGNGYFYFDTNATSTATFNITNLGVCLFDLTLMGLDSITVDKFTKLFPLPYYSYESGKLLSFNGTGIKTVGFNQWDEEWEVGAITAQGQPSITADRIRSKNFIPAEPNTRYFRKTPNNLQPFFYDANQQFINYGLWGTGNFTTPNNCAYMKFQVDPVYGLSYKNDICINISNTELNGTYEPYTSSTLSLPISTYFPTGMKSAGTVYDELTPRKAEIKVGTVDLGTLTWYYSIDLFTARINDGAYTGSSVGNANGRCVLYEAKAVNPRALEDKQMTLGTAYAFANVGNIVVKDSAYTSASAFKTAMSGVYLYYELATPTETSFTTASLVTENAEIPLSNEDGVLVGKCTEELSAEPGFHDAKIKLSDADGECYSNKIQLHVERSPQ